MKALKEKRISLRSLWRRGLVILSLFALVFASCGDSGSGDTDETKPPDKKVLTAEWVGGLPTKQYEGTKFDWGTLGVKVTWDDGTDKTYTAKDYPKLFSVTPELVQGVVLKSGDDNYYWRPYTDFVITSAAGEVPNLRSYTPTVVPIQRGVGYYSINGGNTSAWVTVPIYYQVGNASNVNGQVSVEWLQFSGAMNGYHTLPTLSGHVMTSAVELTGDLTGNREVYIDQPPKLDGFKMQATYTDLEKKDLWIEQATFEVRPYYYSATDRDQIGKGDLLVTVGKWDTAIGTAVVGKTYAGITAPITVAKLNGIEGGLITARHPYDKVYHVKKIEVIDYPTVQEAAEGKRLDELAYIYYWGSDNTSTWQANSRLGNKTLRITYVDGAPNSYRDVKINTLGKSAESALGGKIQVDGTIWWNTNPYDTGLWATAPTTMPADDYKTFGIWNVRDSTTPANKYSGGNPQPYNKLTEPVVNINYRGAETTVPVDVGIKVSGINVKYKDGVVIGEDGELTVDVKPLDNDVAGKDALWYSKQVEVSISIDSARGQTYTEVLAYAPVGSASGTEDYTGSVTDAQTGLQGKQTVTTHLLNYNMDFGYVGQRTGTNAVPYTYDKGASTFYGGWGQAFTRKNANNIKAVTFYFWTPIVDSTINNTTSSKRLKDSLNVYWVNIPSTAN